MNRIPIILRKPIIDNLVINSPKVICKDCINCKHNSSENLYVTNYDSEHLNQIEEEIWKKQSNGEHLRIITSQEVSKEVIWAASYSEKNIFQININMTSYKKDLEWLQRTVSYLEKCGLFGIILLHSIIPKFVQTWEVIDIIDRVKSSTNLCIYLKFGVFTHEPKKPTGFHVPVKYLSKRKKVWVCNTEYKREFLDIINLYAEPRKIPVVFCNSVEGCINMGGTNK